MTNWHNEVCNQENKSLPTITTSDMNLPCQSQFHHKLSTPHETSHNNQHLLISAEINIDPPVENQPSIQEPIQNNDSPTDSIDQDTNDQQVYNEPVPIQPELLQAREESAEAQSTTSKNDTSHAIEGHLRRSSRVAKLSAKALQLATENGNKP